MTFDEARWRLQVISEVTVGTLVRSVQGEEDSRRHRSLEALSGHR